MSVAIKQSSNVKQYLDILPKDICMKVLEFIDTNDSVNLIKSYKYLQEVLSYSIILEKFIVEDNKRQQLNNDNICIIHRSIDTTQKINENMNYLNKILNKDITYRLRFMYACDKAFIFMD